jgi:hypothetical protein
VYVLFGVKRWNTLVCQSMLVFVYVSDAIVCTGKRDGGSTPASASCNISHSAVYLRDIKNIRMTT